MGRLAAGGWRLALAAMVTGVASARAAEVSIEIESRITWEGEPVALEVRILNEERGMGRPELPPTPGLVIRGPGRPSSQRQIVNGRASSWLSYPYRIEPARVGKFTIGPATVPRAGGEPLQSGTVELVVSRKPPPGIRFGCAVKPREGAIAVPFRVEYTIYYSGEPWQGGFGGSPFGLQDLDLAVLEMKGIRAVPAMLAASPAQVIQFQNGLKLPLFEGTQQDAEGQGWKTIVLAFDVIPLVTGEIRFASSRVAMRFKGEAVTRRGFFGPETAFQADDQQASTAEVTYTVRDLPLAGRPEAFNGAIGRYTIEVAASPLEVDAFAPLTLDVKVRPVPSAQLSGEVWLAILEQLKPPLWSEVSSLARDFEVATDIDSGKVEKDEPNRTAWKTFRQVIRPKSEHAVQVPPIPFPFYDPAAGKYDVAYSPAIPIKVRAVKTVRAEDSIPSARTAAESGPRDRPAPASIADTAGIGANFAAVGTPRASLDPRAEVFSASFAAAVAAPPLLLLALAAALRFARRDPRERARARALSRARAALGSATSPDAVASAYQSYFRERLGLPAGELTPPDLDRELELRAVPGEVRSRATRLLERLLAGRFGGFAGDAESLAKEASEVLAAVEGCAGEVAA